MNRVVITGMGIWSCLGKNIKEVEESLRAGRSGIVNDPVVLTGDIMTMPGLPKVPAAEKIDVSDEGVISGLF